jgi:toxin ParE1/3/4
MRVAFDPAARRDLEQIFAWIAEDNPRAAQEMIARIEAKVMRLETPGLATMGRRGLVEGTRELLEYPYIIVYKVYEERDEIVVISVVHGVQNGKRRRGRRYRELSPIPSC